MNVLDYITTKATMMVAYLAELGLVPFGGLAVLALFIPVLCCVSVYLKQSRIETRLTGVVSQYNLTEDTYYQIYLKNNHISIISQTWFPILVLTLMNIHLASLTIYTPGVLGPPAKLANFLLLGSRYGLPSDMQSELYILQTCDVMCFAYLGWYVWTVSTIFSRMTTMELVAATYYSVLMRLVIAIFVAIALRHMVALLWPENTKFVAEAVGFGTGLFPNSALIWLTRQLQRYLLGDTGVTDEFSLDLVQGISPFRKLRLYEIGMDNCENLAAANPIVLFLTSNLSLVEVIDWVAEAQLLILVGKARFIKLQENGYRTSVDFERACGSDARSRLGELLEYSETQLLDLKDGVNRDPSFNRLTRLRRSIR